MSRRAKAPRSSEIPKERGLQVERRGAGRGGEDRKGKETGGEKEKKVRTSFRAIMNITGLSVSPEFKPGSATN